MQLCRKVCARRSIKVNTRFGFLANVFLICVIRYATYLVKEKYLNAEVNQFTKKGAPWSEFKLTEKTKEAVKKHLDSKMSKYKAGDVNKV